METKECLRIIAVLCLTAICIFSIWYRTDTSDVEKLLIRNNKLMERNNQLFKNNNELMKNHYRILLQDYEGQLPNQLPNPKLSTGN